MTGLRASSSRRKPGPVIGPWIPVFAGMTILLLSCLLRADDAVLTLPGEAKGAAMGEAYSASAAGAEGLWYNPAGLSRFDVPTMSIMHTMYLDNVSYSNVGFALPFGNQNAIGMGISYLNAGAVSSYDNSGTIQPSYTPNDLLARLAYAKSIFKTSVGISGFFLKSTIQESASTMGATLGVHQILGPTSLAFVAENFGGKIKYRSASEPLPSQIKLGVSVRILPTLTWNTDAVKPKEGPVWLGSGAEVRLPMNDTVDFALRGGYNTRSGADIQGLHGVTAGAGFGVAGTHVNYAWVPFGDLGDTHRISLDVQFGEQEFNPNSERDLRNDSIIKPSPKSKSSVSENSVHAQPSVAAAKALPVAPWKKRMKGWRTSKDKMIDLLARDALCTGAGARALVTRTMGVVTLQQNPHLNKWARIRAGRYLFEGDTVRTAEAALADFIFANGVKAQVGANTIVTIKTNQEFCERAETELKQGELYTVSEEDKEMKVETPLGQAVVKNAHARVSYDGKTVLMRVQYGTGTFTSDGVETMVRANSTFAKTSEGKTQKVANNPNENTNVNITPPDARTTPGRWDPNFAKTFSREMMRLDSVPGLHLAEYIKDTKMRDEIKLKVGDMRGRQKDIELQVDGYQKDVEGFSSMKDQLRNAIKGQNPASVKDLKINLKQTNQALAQAQKSLGNVQKELKAFLMEMRKNEELLAILPIVRMLNITAQESTIPFATGRSVVPQEAEPVLDSIAESMTQMRPFRVVVEGHTDKTGSAVANKRLSKQRAEAVALYLRKKTGLPARIFLIKGMGSEQPIEAGESPEAMAKNRRVEIWFELRGL